MNVWGDFLLVQMGINQAAGKTIACDGEMSEYQRMTFGGKASWGQPGIRLETMAEIGQRAGNGTPGKFEAGQAGVSW